MNRINLICLGVLDINVSLNFYKQLGFETKMEENAAIVFFNNQGSKLELFPIDKLVKDIDPNKQLDYDLSLFSGITLACNMRTKDDVNAMFSRVKKIGGTIVKEPQTTDWGGYSGYFKDPNGYYWEIAYADSWQFDEQEMLVIE